MQGLSVAERIRKKFDVLTRAERQLANAMLDNYPLSGLGSITAVAALAGVSSPSVARMAKKLEFNGFPAMQKSLRDELTAQVSKPVEKHDRWFEAAPETHTLNRYADVVMENLQKTLQHIDLETFNAVIALLMDRKRVIHIVGGRSTRCVADYLFSNLQMARDDLLYIPPNSNSWPHYLLNMLEEDVLVVFDVRRYEHDLLRLSELAAEKNVRIILFTDQWGSPVTKLATHSIHCRTEIPSKWDSSTIIMFLVEALIAAIQKENLEQTKDRMENLEHFVDRMEMFTKFT